MRQSLLVALVLLPALSRAQTVGTCPAGAARGTIVPNLVKADLYTTGTLFLGPDQTNGDGYLVPRETGLSPIFAASLWLAGQVDGRLRVSATSYSGPSFWPGPLPGPDQPPADCAAYDRVFSVSRQDVVDYYRTGLATDDLRDWPDALGAPVVDGDGVPGNYNLAGGDQPALRGDAVAWWIMNDLGNQSQFQIPLGVEVRVEAFGFAQAPLGATTFYRYTVSNRRGVPVDSVYAGLFVDPDLGYVADDYLGTDTTSAMAYVYNADNDDDASNRGYGVAPPAIGVQIVRGPAGLPNGRDDDRDGVVDEPGERLGLTASPVPLYTPPAATVEPTPAMFANPLRGLLRDGSSLRERGTGIHQAAGAVTRFLFAGDPVTGTGWTERSNNTTTGTNPPGDRRLLVATGPFRLAPGVSETITFAIPYARGTSNLDSVRRLRGLARGIQQTGDFEPQPVPTSAQGPVSSGPVRLSRPVPNPFTSSAVVRYEVPTGTPLRATLHDALGRQVAVLADGAAAAADGELVIDGTRLAPGVYRVRVAIPGADETLTLVRTQ